MIDFEFQNKLRAKYNPDGSILRNHQLKMLSILQYVDGLCKKYGIEYWLSSGTCLGAIRHQGFIPWDDDLDIEMTRENFVHFVSVFKETDDYILQTRKNDLYYPSGFAKVRLKNSEIYDSLYKYKGVFIDVFCIEKINIISASFFNIFFQLFGIKLYKLLKNNRDRRVIFNVLSSIFIVCKKIFYCFSAIDRIVNKLIPMRLYRHTYGTGWSQNTRDMTCILPLESALFEGQYFPVPHNYDFYLRKIYGDYMKLPDDCQRKNTHVQHLNI